MKFRKSICILAAAVMAASMLTACGGDDKESGSKSADSAAAVQADPAASAEDVAANLRSGITYVDDLNTISADMIEKLYGISADKYSSAAVYVGGVSTAEEIACFDAVDETAASDILAACEKRIEDLKTQVESYNPDELPKLNTPVLLTKGNSVYMCLSNDNDKAEEIIG